MSEQEQTKVYELAKELGMDSLSLIDKLNTLNIRVKSHMSELSSEDLQKAREAFATKTSTKASAKASTKVSTTKVATKDAKPTPTKKTVVKSRKKASDSETQSTETAAKGTAPIIRRRIKTDGEATETVVAGNVSPYLAPEEPQQGVSVEELEDSTDLTEEKPVIQSQAPTPIETEPSTSETRTEPSTPPKKPKAPITPFTRPVAPRKSFLKIVELPKPTSTIQPPSPSGSKTSPGKPSHKGSGPASSKQPVMRGTTTQQDKDGFRIIKMTKENLDQMVEDEAAKKRTGARDAELNPEDVRFADYRKKELIFLPKKKKIPVGKEIKHTQITTPKAIKRVVEMGETITVGDLASQLGVKAAEIIRKLMGLGQMATVNQSIDLDTTTLIATEYQYEVKNISFKEGEILDQNKDNPDDLLPRPPIVTIMGHVDHGKTSLLDSIRETNVAGGEAGGITQHIGAYSVEKDGRMITFIDTPGHEAFTVMRARGANVTDIVILVVAADDGVMPQTREALSHAQAANVPIIVAVNKMDKPQANAERVKQQLAELNLLAEDWGGQTLFVPVSAIKKQGIDKLLEAILLQAEVLELKANPKALAQGTVLEARLEKGRGPVVSLLVNRGTLKIGDPIVAGAFSGRIKAMIDARGNSLKEVGPAWAVEVLGFEGVPHAGERFDAVASETDAKSIAENRQKKQRSAIPGSQGKVTLDDLFAKIQEGTLKELSLVLKADVYGSLEAIRDSLQKLSNEQIKIKIIHSATGGITESDVLLASASQAIIIGFNVRPEGKAKQTAEAEHIEIKTYTIIYELIDDVKKAMVGLLDKTKLEKYLGRAEVRQIFTIPKAGTIAGCSVIDGKILRSAQVRLLRDNKIIYEGKLGSLKRFKDDAKEVAQGFECGMSIENYNDLKPGDVIEAYEIELITPELLSPNLNTSKQAPTQQPQV